MVSCATITAVTRATAGRVRGSTPVAREDHDPEKPPLRACRCRGSPLYADGRVPRCDAPTRRALQSSVRDGGSLACADARKWTVRRRKRVLARYRYRYRYRSRCRGAFQRGIPALSGPVPIVGIGIGPNQPVRGGVRISDTSDSRHRVMSRERMRKWPTFARVRLHVVESSSQASRPSILNRMVHPYSLPWLAACHYPYLSSRFVCGPVSACLGDPPAASTGPDAPESGRLSV